MSDHVDLLVEQVKMLAGEIAFGTSTLKRLAEQSVNDPESSRAQVISISFTGVWSVLQSVLFFLLKYLSRINFSAYYQTYEI